MNHVYPKTNRSINDGDYKKLAGMAGRILA